MDFIRARDGKLLCGGRPMLLKGVGLGGWLLPEGYMWQLYTNCDRPRRMEALIENLCGKEYQAEFWRRYYEAYITERDFDYIAAQGFNSVRLPFNARHMLRCDSLNEEYVGFIDRCVRLCEERGLYVVLDMHAAPGGQTGQNIDDSERDFPELFTDPENEKRLVLLWGLLAQRYADCPAVAGYDLLNEPLTKRHAALYPKLLPLYRRLIREIRKNDSQHMIILEGLHWATDFSVFDELTREQANQNIMLQFHKYWSPPDAESLAPFLQTALRLNVPLYCGESGENNTDWYTAAFPVYERLNISWCFWSYKKMGVKNSVSVFETPKLWGKLTEFLDAGGEIRDACGLFDSLLESIGRSTFNGNVVRAVMRRAPLQIPCEAYDVSDIRSRKTGGALLRQSESASLVFADRHVGVPDYRRYGGEPQPESERILLRLSAGDAVGYSFTADAVCRAEVVFSGKGSLTASCAARTSEASAKGICELEGIAPDTHRQTLWVRCTSGTVCLDYIDIKLSKA